MPRQNKILSHPDKEEIIEWIMDGVPVRDISDRLKERYPKKRQAHLRVSFSTVQLFKTEYLNLNKELVEAAKRARQGQEKVIKMEAAKEEIRKLPSYQEKMNELVDSELNVRNEILKIYSLIDSRMEYFFNKLQEHEFPNPKEEKVFQGYIDQFLKLLEHYKKFVEGYTDKVEHNINVNIINDQVTILREALREVLMDTDPELVVAFMNKLNLKMRSLEYGQDEIVQDLFSNKFPENIDG